jgi:multidrug transporter EmrE-like cation transporter
LTLAVKRIDISVAYAVWSGLGTAIVAGFGAAWFGALSHLRHRRHLRIFR